MEKQEQINHEREYLKQFEMANEKHRKQCRRGSCDTCHDLGKTVEKHRKKLSELTSK